MSIKNTQELISVAQEDFLAEDPPIRGQKYCCLSFISPEDVIKNKEVYFFHKFLEAFTKDITDLFTKSKDTFKETPEFVDGLKGIEERYSYLFGLDQLQEEFEFYKAAKSATLEEEYLEKNNFQTTIRGLKVRGSYETLKEAQIRAQMLKRMDDKFHVFVAAVGCWCPWSPNPEELENQEYAESHLNTLVKRYLDNQKDKDEFFLKRKNDLKNKAIQENEERQSKLVEKVEEDATPVTQEGDSATLTDKLEDVDPWLQKKHQEADETNPNIETVKENLSVESNNDDAPANDN